MDKLVEAIAFYLPQYHPIAINDDHWGKGFTEWNNVVKARPTFLGHYQPHMPADLGFYDLRVPDVRRAQLDMAGEAGISAFCLYHYWFHGRRIMDRPVDDFFTDPVHQVRLMLCWANESWTLEWRGRDDVTTLNQEYSEKDDYEHAELLVNRYLGNPRYFTYEGRPVVLIYHPRNLEADARMVRILREVSKGSGIDPLVGGCVAFDDADFDVRTIGFDFAVRWSPNWSWIGSAEDRRTQLLFRAQQKLLGQKWPRFRGNQAFKYASLVDEHLRRDKGGWPTVETAFPSWDNTARRERGGAVIVTEPRPEVFERWLHALKRRLRADDPQLVFINAWNEWAEGCHLEPDQRYGHTWLDVCSRVFKVQH